MIVFLLVHRILQRKKKSKIEELYFYYKLLDFLTIQSHSYENIFKIKLQHVTYISLKHTNK